MGLGLLPAESWVWWTSSCDERATGDLPDGRCFRLGVVPTPTSLLATCCCCCCVLFKCIAAPPPPPSVLGGLCDTILTSLTIFTSLTSRALLVVWLTELLLSATPAETMGGVAVVEGGVVPNRTETWPAVEGTGMLDAAAIDDGVSRD